MVFGKYYIHIERGIKSATRHNYLGMEETVGYSPRGDCTTNPQEHQPFIPKHEIKKNTRTRGQIIDIDVLD